MFYMFIIGCTYIQKTFPLLLFFTGTTARIFKDRSLYYCVLQVRPLVYLEIVPFIIVFYRYGHSYIQRMFPLLLCFTGTTARIFRDRSLYYCVLQVRPLVYLEIVPFIIVFTGTTARIFGDRPLYYCIYRDDRSYIQRSFPLLLCLQVRPLVYLEIVTFIIVFTGTAARIFGDRSRYHCVYRYDRSYIQRSFPLVLCLQVRTLVYLEIVTLLLCLQVRTLVYLEIVTLLLCLQVLPLVYLEIVTFIIVFTGTAARIFRDRSHYYCVYRDDRSYIQRSFPLLLCFTGTTARIFGDRHFIIVFTGTTARIFRDRSLYYCVYR